MRDGCFGDIILAMKKPNIETSNAKTSNLALRRETLRALDRTELAHAVGGIRDVAPSCAFC